MTRIEDKPDDPPPYRYRSIWHMIAAPVVWSVHFAGVYAWTALSCARFGGPDEARLGIALATAAALALIVVIGWRAWKQWDFLDDYDDVHDAPTTEHRREFLGHAGWLLSIISAIGVLFVAAPAFYIGSCL